MHTRSSMMLVSLLTLACNQPEQPATVAARAPEPPATTTAPAPRDPAPGDPGAVTAPGDPAPGDPAAPPAARVESEAAPPRPEPPFEPLVDPATTRDTLDPTALRCPDGTGVFGLDEGNAVYCVKLPIPKGGIPQRHGPAIWFHDNGRVHEMGAYVDHQRQGVWAAWDEEGNKKSVITWKDDHYDGLYVTYWPNGTRQSEIEWRGNKKHGVSRTWADDGSVLAVRTYVDDRVAE
jgi:hypothetical protein